MGYEISQAIRSAKADGTPGGATLTPEEATQILKDAVANGVTLEEANRELKDAGFTPPSPPAQAQGQPAAPPEAPMERAPGPIVNPASVHLEKEHKPGLWRGLLDIIAELFTLGHAKTQSFDDKIGKDELKDLEKQAQRLVETEGFLQDYQLHGRTLGSLDLVTLRHDVRDALRAAYPKLKSDGIDRRTDLMVKAIEARVKSVTPTDGEPLPVAPPAADPIAAARLDGGTLRVPRALLGDEDLASVAGAARGGLPASGVGRSTAPVGELETLTHHKLQVEVVVSRARADGPVTWETAIRLGGKVVPKEIVDKLLDSRPMGGLAPLYGWLMEQELTPPVAADQRDELAAEIYTRLQGQTYTPPPPPPPATAAGTQAAPGAPGAPPVATAPAAPPTASAPAAAPTASAPGAPPDAAAPRGAPAAAPGGPPATAGQ